MKALVSRAAESVATTKTREILYEIQRECVRREVRGGADRGHPLGMGLPDFAGLAEQAKHDTDEATKDGTLTWRHIVNEEFFEMVCESDPDRVREEAIQLAAVVVQIVKYIDGLK